MKSIVTAALTATLLILVQTYNSTAPTWQADSNFAAGSHVLFSASTSAPFLNNYTVTYGSSFIDNPPAFTFGIKAYEGTLPSIQETIIWFRNISIFQCTQSLIYKPLFNWKCKESQHHYSSRYPISWWDSSLATTYISSTEWTSTTPLLSYLHHYLDQHHHHELHCAKPHRDYRFLNFSSLLFLQFSLSAIHNSVHKQQNSLFPLSSSHSVNKHRPPATRPFILNSKQLTLFHDSHSRIQSHNNSLFLQSNHLQLRRLELFNQSLSEWLWMDHL